jgi:hypothetical protein
MISLNGYQIPSDIINIICSNCYALAKYMFARTNKQSKLLFGKIMLYDMHICMGAALIGSLGILKWACKNNCDWDFRTCSYAAQDGHNYILKWVRKKCLRMESRCM